MKRVVENLKQEPRLSYGYLAEEYDGIGKYVGVTLVRAGVSIVHRARVAAGDFGGARKIPAGSRVPVFSYHGQVEVLLGNHPGCCIDKFNRVATDGWSKGCLGEYDWPSEESWNPGKENFSIVDGVARAHPGSYTDAEGATNPVIGLPFKQVGWPIEILIEWFIASPVRSEDYFEWWMAIEQPGHEWYNQDHGGPLGTPYNYVQLQYFAQQAPSFPDGRDIASVITADTSIRPTSYDNANDRIDHIPLTWMNQYWRTRVEIDRTTARAKHWMKGTPEPDWQHWASPSAGFGDEGFGHILWWPVAHWDDPEVQYMGINNLTYVNGLRCGRR